MSRVRGAEFHPTECGGLPVQPDSACDNCPDTEYEDRANSGDSDTPGDACDSSSDDDNEDQADSNMNGVGDVCDGGIKPGDANLDKIRDFFDAVQFPRLVFLSGADALSCGDGRLGAPGEPRVLRLGWK